MSYVDDDGYPMVVGRDGVFSEILGDDGGVIDADGELVGAGAPRDIPRNLAAGRPVVRPRSVAGQGLGAEIKRAVAAVHFHLGHRQIVSGAAEDILARLDQAAASPQAAVSALKLAVSAVHFHLARGQVVQGAAEDILAAIDQATAVAVAEARAARSSVSPSGGAALRAARGRSSGPALRPPGVMTRLKGLLGL